MFRASKQQKTGIANTKVEKIFVKIFPKDPMMSRIKF